jgi:hypothetical protein
VRSPKTLSAPQESPLKMATNAMTSRVCRRQPECRRRGAGAARSTRCAAAPSWLLHQAEDEVVAEEAFFDDLEAQESEESDQDRFTDPSSEYFAVKDDN